MRYWEKSDQGLILKRRKSEVINEIRKLSQIDPLLFGSVARGTASVESDIDILIPEMIHSPEKLEEIRLNLQEILGYDVDLVSYLGTPNSMVKHILNYGKSIKRM